MLRRQSSASRSSRDMVFRMTEYAIEFDDRDLREWDERDGSIRKKFEKKLEKCS
ncbi:hypothetical protein ACLRDC_04360 [Gluconacetobacter sacchari]